jgi:FAD/FMN-containing dehydrogenase
MYFAFLNLLKVKGGGHGMAPTVSSTTGIQISMARFSKVQYNPKTRVVEIGAGCLWDQVYSKLTASGRNVIGGASSDGVGVAGWLLGGGYSLKSNRYGLGIDHIVEYEIVTPDGRVRKVNAGKEGKLFQALRVRINYFVDLSFLILLMVI